MPDNQQTPILNLIRTNWMILVFLGSILIGWNQLNNQTKLNTERITRLEALQVASQIDLNSVRSDLVEIKTTLQFIKQQVTP